MIIDGKVISAKRKDLLKEKIELLKQENKRIPQLTVIIVGDHQASLTYVRNKEIGCQYVGIKSNIIHYESSITQDELISKIDELNKDDDVDGILVQLPLPPHIDSQSVINAIDPLKDVDGFHPSNASQLFLGYDCLVPCTPKGLMVLLDEINYDLKGKEVVVVGRSNIVGKPAAMLALQRHATVTIAHSKTKNLKEVCKKADVLIAAVGRAKMIDKDYIKEGAVVLDVGINRDENNKLCGDIDYNSVKDHVSYITPVPGGVGPMTIAMLLENTYEAYMKREGK